MFDLNLAISMKKNPCSEKSSGSCGGWPSHWSNAAGRHTSQKAFAGPKDVEWMPALFPGAPGTTLSASAALWLGAAGAQLPANPPRHQLHGGAAAVAGFGRTCGCSGCLVLRVAIWCLQHGNALSSTSSHWTSCRCCACRGCAGSDA